MALPMKGRTKFGPGMKRFLVRYVSCSRRRRRRMKHMRYGISCVSERDVGVNEVRLVMIMVLVFGMQKMVLRSKC